MQQKYERKYRPNYKSYPRITMDLPKSDYDAAITIAHGNNTTLSQVLRDAVRFYLVKCELAKFYPDTHDDKIINPGSPIV